VFVSLRTLQTVDLLFLISLGQTVDLTLLRPLLVVMALGDDRLCPSAPDLHDAGRRAGSVTDSAGNLQHQQPLEDGLSADRPDQDKSGCPRAQDKSINNV